MSGNCDSLDVEFLEYPSKVDYEIIRNDCTPKYFLWFLIMSLFWRYEFNE